MIPEIDIWRAAQLMLKRYGEKGSRKAPLELTSSRLPAITTTWRRIMTAVTALANKIPPGPVH